MVGPQSCLPIDFGPVKTECKNKLEWLLMNRFRKNKMFNDLLLEICQIEIKQQFYHQTKIFQMQRKPKTGS